MTEPDPGSELEQIIGACGLEGLGALGLIWLAGPTLRSVGKAFGDWTDWRLRNLLRLGERVQARRTGDDDPDAKVHPRVLHEVLDRGSWTDDDVAQEYLAGMLLSARDKHGIDEDAAYLAAIVAGMTSTQIRLHHAVYAAIDGSGNRGLGLDSITSRRTYAVHIPARDFKGISPRMIEGWSQVNNAVHALHRDRLIDEEYGVGGHEYLDQHFPEGAGPGLMVQPSSLGVELYLRAHGLKHAKHSTLLDGLPSTPINEPMPVSPHAQVGPVRNT